MKVRPTEPSLFKPDASKTRAERVAFYRKLYTAGVGKSPSRFKKVMIERAARLDAWVDEVQNAGVDHNGIVRLINVADRQRQRLTWLNGDKPRDPTFSELWETHEPSSASR